MPIIRGVEPSARATCYHCRSRLEIFETASGGRTVSVGGLGAAVEEHAIALERFFPPDAGPEIRCPACDTPLDPASPYRGEQRARPHRAHGGSPSVPQSRPMSGRPRRRG